MRSRLAALIFVLAIGFQSGCAAIQHPDLGEVLASPATHTEDDKIRVVAVRPPSLRYEDPVDEGLQNEIEESAHLIRALRRTGLFDKVDYTTEVGCPIDIEVAAARGEYPRLTMGPFWLYIATLSIAIIDSREGVSFYPIDAPEVRVEISYQTRMYVGIVPLLASPVLITGLLPNWEFAGVRPTTDERLRTRLQAELPALAPHRGNALSTCPASS